MTDNDERDTPDGHRPGTGEQDPADAGSGRAGDQKADGPIPSELVDLVGAVAMQEEGSEGGAPVQAVTEPAKVMRIGSMVKQLLEEVRMTSLDEASRERLAEVYERSIAELGSSLSDDLRTELHHLALPFRDDGPPSESELRVAKAQLVGWLEGLFHGIQATLFAQQLAARQQLEQMRQLPQGPQQGGPPQRPGTYL